MRRFNDFKDGDIYNATMMVKSSSLSKTAKGKSFARVNFITSLRESINAMQWGVNTLDLLQEGAVLDIVGKVNVYNGQKSIFINDVRVNTSVGTEAFMDKDPMTPEDAVSEFKKIFETIQSEDLKLVVSEVLSKAKGYFVSPAAKGNHHAHKTGLAFHSITMAKLAIKFCEVYPTLNYDLMVAGALVHDAGKTIELMMEDHSIVYSTSGTLFGHIVIINDLIQEVIFNHPELKSNNEIAQLKHIVLSHHGKTEWGSPVIGMTREAIMLHQIDLVDAQMNMIEDALSTSLPGEFTNKVWAMENRPIFNPGESNIIDY